MTTDQQFIKVNQSKTINFKPRNLKTQKGLPVGKYFVITNGYKIYNRELKVPFLDCTFSSIIDAYNLCTKLIEIYDDYLDILIDERYADSFFRLTQYSVKNGVNIYTKISSLDGTVKRADLMWILG